ncbi:MAG: hypothetical protein V4536_00500 [Pseudomonadota bacterium]
MATFNICKIQINDFHHLFDDLILSLASSLHDLGHECGVSVNEMAPGAINIFIGSIIFDDVLTSVPIDYPYIVYQLEILDNNKGHLKNFPNYLAFLKRAQAVWDYSPKNVSYLESNGFTNVLHVPPGYHLACERIPRQDFYEYDFMFVGSLSPRRRVFLERLLQQGHRVGAITEINCTFGDRRDQLIGRSKFIVNVHCFDDLNHLETVRLSYLLTNRIAVISEVSDHDPYEGAIGYAPYSELAAFCASMLKDGDKFQNYADAGYAAIKKIDMVLFVKNAIAKIHFEVFAQ